MKNKIIAVDFDGTLCENRYPTFGEPRKDVIEKLIKEQQAGARVILWTCRRGEDLAAAIYWSLEQGLVFDAINENLKETTEYFGGDGRKIYADEYWDDRAVQPFKRDDNALALDILDVLEARVALCKRRAEHYGPYSLEGTEARIKAEEGETLRDFIKIIINGHGITAKPLNLHNEREATK